LQRGATVAYRAKFEEGSFALNTRPGAKAEHSTFYPIPRLPVTLRCSIRSILSTAT
jgi:hypothetical protein